MKYCILLLYGFLLGTSTLVAHADVPTPLDEFLDGGPFEQHEVRAQSPTPYLTGFNTKTRLCLLLRNVDVQVSEGIGDVVDQAHEAGHCHALRLGLQQIDGPVTQFGEVFGDVFALAWVSKNMPERLGEAQLYLLQHRSMDRQISSAYNTVFMIRQAMVSLPSTKSPLQFTVDLLQDK